MVNSVTCPICQQQNQEKTFESLILGKYAAIYYFCDHCEFLFLPKPTWLKEAYANAITLLDTGLVSRNLQLARDTALLTYFCFDRQSPCLDFAGGYGLLGRLLRDVGFDFYWYDRFCQNLFMQGLEGSITNRTYALATCFEVLEHLENPLDELQQMFEVSDSVFLSTTLLPDPIPQPGTWHYYAPEHGQHISFYRWRTIEVMAEILQCRAYRFGKRAFLLTRRSIAPWRWWIVTRGPRRWLHRYIQKHMRSLTGADGQAMAQQLRRV